MFDISEGTYPRSFPYDPDFTFQERELVNKTISKSNFLLEPFASRLRLISYEFLTFFNLLSSPLKEVIFLYDESKGRSIFVNILNQYTRIENIEKSVFSPISLNCYKVYKREKEPETIIEKGVDSWLKKIRGEKNYNFIIDQEIVKTYLKKISVTDIISYLDCPTDFMFRKILNFKDSYSIEAIEGIIYHELINKLSNHGFDERTFEEVFSKAAQGVERRKLEILKPFIKENIRKFLTLFKKDSLFSHDAKKEVDIKVKILEYCLDGRVDWIVKSGNSYQVADFKRGAVSSGNYDPGKKRACQIVLYGLGLFEDGDVIRAYKSNKHENIDFHFISIPKITATGNSWKLSFNGKESSHLIRKNLSWTYLALKLIYSGFFAPFEIVPYKKPFRGKLFNLKLNGRCKDYECYLNKDYLESIKEKIEKKLLEIEEKLWQCPVKQWEF